MIPLFPNNSTSIKLKSLLKKVEDFKSWRNALSHGTDVSDNEKKRELKIEVMTRAGKEKVIHITPESHEAKISEADKLLSDLNAVRKSLNKTEPENSADPKGRAAD
jgi:hypothetical protein